MDHYSIELGTDWDDGELNNRDTYGPGDPAIGKQGWLRAIFWVDEKARTIYVVDLFWKKTNAVSTADKLRADDRIRRLKAELKKGQKPWG